MDKKKAGAGSHSAESQTAAQSSSKQSVLANSKRALRQRKTEGGNVYYYDGEVLKRPLFLPKTIKSRMIIIVILAVIIGAGILYAYFDGIVNAPAREQQAVQENLAREVTLSSPALKDLVSLSDADIMATLSATGDTLYEKKPVGSGSSFDVIKLPSGVSLAEAGSLYLAGIDKLSPSQAIRLLNGSWDLDVNREKGMNMSLHYADFSAGSVENAVQAALRAQGLDEASITDSGVDDSGNVYSSGNIVIGDTTYTWKVSSVPLSAIYKITGAPESAAYVGVRFTA